MTNASIDGFYAAYMSGKQGLGFAMLVFRKGRITGADAAGVMFDGQYSNAASDVILIEISVKAPPNTPLIQGGTTGPQGEEGQLQFQVPLDFSAQKFVRIETQRGPINVKLNKLRELDE